MISNSSSAGNTSWSNFRIVTTPMPINLSQHEYVHLYARGTGARNHQSSIIKVDDNVLLDHAVMRGFYLVVLDRYTLKSVFSQNYDLMLELNATDVNPSSNIEFTSY